MNKRSVGRPVSSPNVNQHVRKLRQHSLRASPHKLEDASPWTVDQSNACLCSMSSSREMGALKKVWLNKGDMATILPLKGLEKMWHIVYGSRMQATLSSRTTTKACLTLTSRSLRLKRRSLLCRLHEGTWKALPSVKWRKCGGLARCKECGGIPPTATFWEWYVAA